MSAMEIAARLDIAAMAIQRACELAAAEILEEDGQSEVTRRLANFPWAAIEGSLEEVAAELHDVASVLIKEPDPVWKVTYRVDKGWYEAIEKMRTNKEYGEVFDWLSEEKVT